MKTRHLLFPILSLLLACSGKQFTAQDRTAIQEVMSQQQAAWNTGDIPAFMDGYCDSVCFISKKGSTCGKAAVTARYKEHYPDKAAMGTLAFDRLEIIGAGPDAAWCTGNWQLLRAQDTLGGGFSLLWNRTPQGWRILRDHTY